MSGKLRVRLRASALVACAFMLGACATTAPRVKTDDASLARQGERERALANQPNWQLAGRLGVSNAKDAGSGSLTWKQDGDAFRFS
ncbi:MAG TPA: lipoprotein insertase outer membrane protein LolB, partial [Rhodanobacteraceae bacterium]|nr:lipoprotein insertase outer membrane protein LolB [Rhodanobacteraceae bacterium]